MRKPVLDHGNVLNVHRAVTGWQARWRPYPGGRRVSESSWWRRDGRLAGRINHTVEIETEDEGTLILEYRLNGEPRRQVFDLVGQPCRFGGRRWLARCPRTGRLVAKLYGCTGTFQPRHLLHASYHSQGRVPATEKLRDREIAILRRLDADDASRCLPKPKWMRWDTYGRLIRELRLVRHAYGIGMAGEFFRSTGIDLTDGAAPEILTGRWAASAPTRTDASETHL